jgi:hypothetical protein
MRTLREYLRDAKQGKFMARGQITIEMWRDRLNEAVADLAVLEQRELDQTVAIGTSDDRHAGVSIAAEIRTAQDRVAQARRLLRKAEQDEVERKAGLRDKEHQAKIRATRQHLADFQRDAAAVAAAEVVRQSALAAMIGTAGKINILLPPSARGMAPGIEDRLSAVHLHRLVAVEAYRLDPDTPRPPMPDGVLTHRTGAITPLVETVGDLADLVKNHLEPVAPANPLRGTHGATAAELSEDGKAAVAVIAEPDPAAAGRVYVGSFDDPATSAASNDLRDVEPLAEPA